MANLLESVAKQPIDPNEDHSKLNEDALALVRKVFNEINKPNGVLFKRDDGNLIAVLIKENKWDWDNCIVFDMNERTNKHDDISAKDPFEFVFIKWDEENGTYTTMDKKTIIPKYSMFKLFDENKFQETIERDYEYQYGPI